MARYANAPHDPPNQPTPAAMLASTDPLYISPANYLAGELVSPIRHEYRQGEVFAMTGGTQIHATIVLNLATALKLHLRGSGCRPFSENMKVQLEAVNAFYYPDLVVTCDERDNQPTQTFIAYPCLIMEVLSPSTAAFDRGEKFADYRTLPTLVEYGLVSTEGRQVDLYQRNETGQWSRASSTDANPAPVWLRSVNLELSLDTIYEAVRLS